MAEMYSKNHAVSYKLHVIKQTVNTINCNDYMLWLNFAIKQNLVVLYVVPGLANVLQYLVSITRHNQSRQNNCR